MSTSSSTIASSWNGPLGPHALLEKHSTIILPLSENAHKGSSGRIAILGGSAQYTGAPYYAAMASLQAGADLAFVLTAHEAALPLKCYSPELMVLPVYHAQDFEQALASNNTTRQDELVTQMVDMITEQLPRTHCLVIGPGMGRSPLVWKAVKQVIHQAKERNLSLVLDADALFMLSQEQEEEGLLNGYTKVVLTPNAMEYQRLFPSGDENGDSSSNNNTSRFQDVTVVRKQKCDHILVNGETHYICEEIGGLKRSGGIGDVLAGTLGTMLAWKSLLDDKLVNKSSRDAPSSGLALSCWAACCFVKRATALAFAKKKRAMTAPDVLEHLGQAMDEMIPDDFDDNN